MSYVKKCVCGSRTDILRVKLWYSGPNNLQSFGVCAAHAICVGCHKPLVKDDVVTCPDWDTDGDPKFMHLTPACVRTCVGCHRYLSPSEKTYDNVSHKEPLPGYGNRWGRPVVCTDDGCSVECPHCYERFATRDEIDQIEQFMCCSACVPRQNARRTRKRVLDDLHDVIDGADEYFRDRERPSWADRLYSMRNELLNIAAGSGKK